MRITKTILVLTLTSAVGCGGGNGDGDAGTGGGGDGSMTPGMDGSTTPRPDGAWSPLPDGGCAPVMCQEHLYACGNCMDDDGDGRADWADPDCLGPCDNNERGFDLLIPGGDARPCALDCYFDQDEGFGNDLCTWDHRCDPLEPDPSPLCGYRSPPPADAMCPATQPEACHDFCGPLTPNGCDCFGCCELPAGSGSFVFIGATDSAGNGTCDLASATDPSRCPPCTPVADCLNGCGRCELCLGRTTLPPECTPDGGTPPGERCEPGIQACGLPGDPPCPTGDYCITGCCQHFG